MRISHVCPTCGAELGRVRAPADAVYGLPVVVCPGCGYACVRRRHPLEVRARWAARAAWALARLGLQVFALLAITGTSVSFVVGLRRELSAVQISWWRLPAQLVGAGRTRDVSEWLDGGGRSDLVVWVFVGVIAGAWLRASLSHWRVWTMLLGWLVMLMAVLSLEPIGALITAWLDRLGGVIPVYHGPGPAAFADGLVGVALTGVLSACGVPIGGAILRLGPRYRVWRFGRQRAGIRRLRQA